MASWSPIALVGLLLLAPCAPAPAVVAPSSQSGSETPARPSEATPSAEAVSTQDPTPTSVEAPFEPPTLHRRTLALVSEATPAMDEALARIAARRERNDQVFAKMGGSSVESRAFLHCFSRDRGLNLAEHEALRPVLEHFRSGRIGRDDPFERESLVAQVGWSLRQGLTGRPTRAIQEINATRARFALAFWGGNDVQGRNPRRYAERLIQLIESLEQRGVIPLLAATTPRGDEPSMDGWARRYNVITRGIAEALHLPYVDFYAALADLPNRGLAGDGVHPNVALDGGRSFPCDFSEERLQRGQNQRNLRTLQLLGIAHASMLRGLSAGAEDREGETNPSANEDPAAAPNGGSLAAQSAPPRPAANGGGESAPDAALGSEPTPAAEAQYWIDGVPYSTVVHGESERASYACEGADGLTGPERVFHLRIEESVALEARLVRGEGTVIFLGRDEDGCISRGRNALSMVLEPGDHRIVVESDEGSEPILILAEPITIPDDARRRRRRR
ncbi:MAG: SGNH/GDSL hydrolase family protein [Myxococcota bacterium]